MKKLLAVAGALFVGAALTVASTANAGGRTRVSPTIVFVHGAFADASGFGDSISSLQKQGCTVLAPPNPLRSLSGDAASIRTFLSTVRDPIVLVGHSYGGAVITNAARGNPNVKALVYIAAYALDEANRSPPPTSSVVGTPGSRPVWTSGRTRARRCWHSHRPGTTWTRTSSSRPSVHFSQRTSLPPRPR